MNSINKQAVIRLALLGISLALLDPAAFADKPEWAGKDKEHKEGKENKGHHKDKERERDEDHERHDKHDKHERRKGQAQFQWNDEHRHAVREYYEERSRHGRCPPGLAKKHNGCLPPGQAKKWHRGERLVVKYYELPSQLRVQLPPPPPNHRYVQVASDILLIAIGTSIVVDAVEDILR